MNGYKTNMDEMREDMKKAGWRIAHMLQCLTDIYNVNLKVNVNSICTRVGDEKDRSFQFDVDVVAEVY